MISWNLKTKRMALCVPGILLSVSTQMHWIAFNGVSWNAFLTHAFRKHIISVGLRNGGVRTEPWHLSVCFHCFDLAQWEKKKVPGVSSDVVALSETGADVSWF